MALASLLVFLLLALAEGVGQSAADHVDQAETHRGTAHDSARAELLPEGLAAAARQQEVQTGKRGVDSSRVRLEALETGKAGEEEGGGEEHGKWAERARILREDEGRQNDRGEGVLCVSISSALDLASLRVSRHVPPQPRSCCTSDFLVLSVESSAMMRSRIDTL